MPRHLMCGSLTNAKVDYNGQSFFSAFSTSNHATLIMDTIASATFFWRKTESVDLVIKGVNVPVPRIVRYDRLMDQVKNDFL